MQLKIRGFVMSLVIQAVGDIVDLTDDVVNWGIFVQKKCTNEQSVVSLFFFIKPSN